MKADYIIVGAGAAGCVLAERLSRDSSVRVLLVELGSATVNPLVHVPKGFFRTMRSRRLAYHYPTWPLGRKRPGEFWIRGKALGGSTVINGVMYARGRPGAYDALGARNPGWSWQEMLPVFRAMEDHPLGPSTQHGASGPLSISFASQEDTVVRALFSAAANCGLPIVPDVDSAPGEAIGPVASTIHGGLRVSARTAFLNPALKRPNLKVISGARVGHLVFDGSRCVGIRARHRSRQLEFFARQEVLLSAGTVETPLLLERSGIGAGETLNRAGIRLRHESPHVGQRVIEQRAVTLKLRLRPGLGHNTELNSWPKRIWQGVKYVANRKGPLATGPYPIRASIRTFPELQHPDAEMLLTTISTDATGMAVAEQAGMTIKSYVVRPTTTSQIHVNDPDPEAPPIIEASFLKTENDRQKASALLHRQREFAASQPLASLVQAEVAPGADVQTQEDAVNYALATGAGLYHAVGSCAVGPCDDDVVDHRLRVRGIPGLRIADASIFSFPPASALAAPTMAVGWRAADLLREET